MKEAYRLTRKDGAPGIDGVIANEYAANLEANLLDLLDRIKSGRYKAPPVRRAYVPKTDGSRSGAKSNRHGARGSVRAGLPSLLIRLPARPLGSSSITGSGYCHHEPETALGVGAIASGVGRMNLIWDDS